MTMGPIESKTFKEWSDDLAKGYMDAYLRIAGKSPWLEDILAGLMANGVSKDRIEVQKHDNGMRTVVCVDGEPKYERALSYSIKGVAD